MKKQTLYLLIFCCVFAIASSANAQTKVSGTFECGAADSTYVIQIPDQKGSSFEVVKGKCTWTKPFTIAGIESTYNEEVDFIETTGTSVQLIFSGTAYHINGDKIFVRGTGTIDPKKMIYTGKWIYVGGTGKFQGIKGGGTSSSKQKSAELGGGVTGEASGEYTLPATKK